VLAAGPNVRIVDEHAFAEVAMFDMPRCSSLLSASLVLAPLAACDTTVTATGPAVADTSPADGADGSPQDARHDASRDPAPDALPIAADSSVEPRADATEAVDAHRDLGSDVPSPDAAQVPGMVGQIGGPGEERLGALQVWWSGDISGPPSHICDGWLLTGALSAGAVFAAGFPSEVVPPSAGGLDAFVAAFRETTLHWVRTDGGPADDIGVGVAGVAPNGGGIPEVHVVGTFGGGAIDATATFESPAPVTLSSRGGRDVYWAAYTSAEDFRVPPTLLQVDAGGSTLDDEVTAMSGRFVVQGAPSRIEIAGVEFAGVFGAPSFLASEWGVDLECVDGAGAFAVSGRSPRALAPGPPTALSGGCEVTARVVRTLDDGLLIAGDFGPGGRLTVGGERLELGPSHEGGRDGFVRRAREGTEGWTFTIGGPGDAIVSDVCGFDGGGIFGFTVVGWFTDDASFGDPATTASARGTDGFIVDLAADGTVLDLVRLGGPGDQRALHCTAGSIVGTFGGTLEVPEHALSLTASSASDAFLIRRDMGNGLGAPVQLDHLVAGTTGALALHCTDVWGAGVHNCCVLAGEFQGDVTLSAGSLGEVSLSSRGGTDLFTLYLAD
jgi:hypothetical protein